METRSYLINQELLPFYKKVCKRDEIDYHIICKDGTFFLDAAISNRQFRILREDAVCEKECEASQTKIPVYSYRTLKNPNKFKRKTCQYIDRRFKKSNLVWKQEICIYIYRRRERYLIYDQKVNLGRPLHSRRSAWHGLKWWPRSYLFAGRIKS